MPLGEPARTLEANVICKILTRKWSNLVSLGIWTFVLFEAQLGARPSKDVLLLKNGDKWTCEIKKLDHGYLYVGLDYVDGTVQVDWTKIASIQSSQLFVVTDEKGTVFVGPLSSSNRDSDGVPFLTIQSGQSPVKIAKADVSSIRQTETRFWQNLHGAVSAGSNFTKSNNQSQFSTDANLSYIKRYWSAAAEFQSTFNGSVSAPSDLRRNITMSAMRILNRKNYFAIGVGNLLRSDEQDLALRSTFGGGLGKLLLNEDRARFYVLAGAVWTRERYTATSPSSFNSAEGLVGTRLEYFRFKTTNYYITASAYPSMSNLGRIRFDANTGVKYEIVKDLYLNFNFYLNYDSQPPRATTKSDYGGTSSLGWRF
jgi:hypothetical protein